MKEYIKKAIAFLLCIALCSLLGACAVQQSNRQEQTSEVLSLSLSQEKVTAPARADAIVIDLNGTDATCESAGVSVKNGMVLISQGGTYLLHGSLSGGSILVDAPQANVVLLLSDVQIQSENSAAIYIYKAALATVYLEEESENTLCDAQSYTFADTRSSATEDEPNACLYSKADLVIAGNGKLTVQGNYRNGITSKDTLRIADAQLQVTAVNNGITGKDAVEISNAVLHVDSAGDAIRSTNDTDSSLGYVLLDHSTAVLTAGEDGIQAQTTLQVDGGNYQLVCGKGHTATAVPASSAKGLKAEGSVLISDGAFVLDCCDDAIHAGELVRIAGGSFEISTADDGIHASDIAEIQGGNIRVPVCYEGIEGATVRISGGEISIVSDDDGINAAGGADSSGMAGGIFGRPDAFFASGNYAIEISGGVLQVNARGDGLDSNGSLTISGGTVYVSASTDSGNGALDYDSTGIIAGGTVIAAGAGGMAMNFSDAQQQGSVLLNFSISSTEAVTLYDAQGNELLQYTPPKQYSSVLISCPALQQGQTYTITAGSQTQTLTLDTLLMGNGAAGAGMPGGMRPGNAEENKGPGRKPGR